jgi:hypothetical protein
MSIRAQLCIALLLTSLIVSGGCIFGGGGKKNPEVVQVQQAPIAAAQEPAPPADAAPLAQPPSLKQAPVQPKMQQPAAQASAVQWPNPNANAPRVSDALAPVQPRPQAPPREPIATEAPLAELPSAPIHIPGKEPAASPLPPAAISTGTAPADAPQSKVAVANDPLELSDDASAPRQPVNPPASKSPVAGIVQRENLVEPANGAARRIAQRLRENPGDLSAHLDHQLFRFLSDESVPDLNTMSSLPAEDRELLAALLDGLSNFRNGLRADHNMLLSKKVRPLLELAARLRSQADLYIPTIALCQLVKGFGRYEPMDGRFVAGTQNKAIVYCEIGNVSSQQNGQGEWEAKLQQEAVLYKENGQRVWADSPQTTVDRSRNRRNDFFVAQRIVLPANLSIDRYILKVTVMDEQVKRVAEATMPIEIVASITPQPQQALPAQPPPLAKPALPLPRGADAQPASDRQPADGVAKTGAGETAFTK